MIVLLIKKRLQGLATIEVPISWVEVKLRKKDGKPTTSYYLDNNLKKIIITI